MGQYKELSIAIGEADQLRRERDQARLDLGRARMLLTTARRLVSEERSEINQLRIELGKLDRKRLKESGNLAEENELLRQQLWDLSTIRSSQLGLEPRATIPFMVDT